MAKRHAEDFGKSAKRCHYFHINGNTGVLNIEIVISRLN